MLYKKQNFCCYITLKWQKIKFEKIIWLLYDLEIAKIEISDKKFCCYMTLGKQNVLIRKKIFFLVAIWKKFLSLYEKFLNLVAIFFIWLLYFFIWLLYEFLGENMLLYYWYLGWNKHFRITFSKHRLPKATTNARVAEFKIDLQPRVSNVHIMHLIASNIFRFVVEII